MSEYPAPLGAASVKLPATREAVPLGRLLVSHVLGVWGVDDVVDDATLIISELVTNAVRHGHGPTRDPDGALVGIQVRVQGCSIVTDVWDPNSKLPIQRMASANAEGGRGLWLVDAISDRWDMWAPASGGKVVYAELGVGKPPDVSLVGAPIELPEAVLAASLTGMGEQHLMADTALMLQFVDGLAVA
ncbi:ATP-binding protein [Streptomyces sp. NPDC052773]|uniref:ATP-binding protein n=1 Tax=Streptomyces sp. NPDC052773 TaxID=3365693 RepID=UPI0037D7F5C4